MSNDTTSGNNIAAALQEVRASMECAAKSDGRTAADVELIAVSKTYDADAISPALEAGQRVFGENRVQEAATKWPALREVYQGVELHLIGPLQSNKARQAVELFDVIHTVDRRKIADAIATEMKRQDKQVSLFIQVNTGEEQQKAGIAPRDTVEFVAYCRATLGLEIIGLMCIPPVSEEPGVHFALLSELAKDCGLSKLSMGMSSDYEIAIQFGATHVRVGSAIFGARA